MRLVVELVKLRVKLSSLNRKDVSRAHDDMGKTEFIREEGSGTEAVVVVFRTGIGIARATGPIAMGSSRQDYLFLNLKA